MDTLGLVLMVVVHAASTQDHDGAKYVFLRVRQTFERLKVVFADGGYAGPLVAWVATFCRFTLEIVRRAEGAKGFVLVKKRWIVERTLAWISRCRRLAKDYEYLPESSETMVYVAMIHLMLRRLRPEKQS